MKTMNWKTMALFLGIAGGSISLVLAEEPLYVNQLIKCHEAKFDFDDAVGQLNKHLTQEVVYAQSGFVNTGVPGQINPSSKLIAIKAPFIAFAPTFIQDQSGVLWGCMTLNKK